MKFSLSLFLFLVCLHANAETNSSVAFTDKINAKKSVQFENGPGKRQQRKNKHMNKKRKRKCQQFGRKVYAG